MKPFTKSALPVFAICTALFMLVHTADGQQQSGSVSGAFNSTANSGQNALQSLQNSLNGQNSGTAPSQGHIQGSGSIADQARQIASRHSCESAGQISKQGLHSLCMAFRLLVILEACKTQIPAADYNRTYSAALETVTNMGYSNADHSVCVR